MGAQDIEVIAWDCDDDGAAFDENGVGVEVDVDEGGVSDARRIGFAGACGKATSYQNNVDC